VRRLHHQGQAVGLGFGLNEVSELNNSFFLDLGAGHDPVGQPGILGQANDVGVLIGHDSNPDLTHDRAQVMATSTAHGDRAHNHQLIEVLNIGKLGDGGGLDIAPTKDLFQIHFGYSSSRVIRIVIVFSVNDHAVQDTLHLDFDLVKQGLEFTRLNEFSDVVVGVESFFSRQQSLPDFYRHRRAVCIGVQHLRRSHFQRKAFVMKISRSFANS